MKKVVLRIYGSKSANFIATTGMYSLPRARGFNTENVAHFHDILENIRDDFKITAGTIFNVQKAQQKYLDVKVNVK